MANRREMILETARQLFAERGYNGVSMRDVAGELGFSVGNVTYYFKRKEDLIEACVLEQSQSYHLPPTPGTLMELDRLFEYVWEEIRKKIYYFHHYTQMAQISRRIYELQRAYTRDLYLTLKTAFENLQQSGDIETDEYPGQTEHFVHGLMTAMTYWAPHNSILEEEKDDSGYAFMMCVWSLVYPRLTQKGKTIYLSKVSKRVEKRKSV